MSRLGECERGLTCDHLPKAVVQVIRRRRGKCRYALRRLEVGFQKCAEIRSIRLVFWVRSTWKDASWYMEPRFDMRPPFTGRRQGNSPPISEMLVTAYVGQW